MSAWIAALREPASSRNALSQPLLTLFTPAFSSAATPPNGAAVGNAVVDRLDDAADRLRAVAQRRRAAIDLRSFWIASGSIGTRVILAQVGDVADADAILLDAHAEVSLKPAQDRPAGAGREVDGRGARLAEEQVAEVLRGALLNLAAVDGAERRVGLRRSARRRGRCRRRRGGDRRRRRSRAGAGAACAGWARGGARRGGGAVTVTGGSGVWPVRRLGSEWAPGGGCRRRHR